MELRKEQILGGKIGPQHDFLPTEDHFSHADTRVSAKKRERWPTKVGERSLYTCLSRPLKSAIFCHFEWQLDQFQNWKFLPTLWLSECYILIYDFITGIGFMSKMIPNFREKSELLTFLFILENIGDFLTQSNCRHSKYILLAFIWVYFQMWRVLQSVQKLCSKLARKHKFGVQTPPASFLAGQLFPIGSSTCR